MFDKAFDFTMVSLAFCDVGVRAGTPYTFKNIVFYWFYNKTENLCYHGTGSEEGAREGTHGH